MSKFLYLCDTHIKGKNPENRIGSYLQDVMAKMKEVVFLSVEHAVDFVIHGGDLFNSPDVSNTIIDDFIDLVEASKKTWYIIWGNHDCVGHDPKLSKASALAHIFRRSKYIKHLDSYAAWDDKKSETTAIQGFDYYHNIENDIKEKGLLCNTKAKYKIAVTHAFITLKPFLPHVLHIQMKDIKTDFDIVLCSHYHKDWGIKEMNGTKFVNLGAIGRQGIDEVDRVPKVLLVDTETKELEIIKLKSAKEGKEVFDLEKIAKIKAFEANIDKFINSLGNIKLQSLDVRGKIEQIAKETNTDREIVDALINRIGRYETQ